MAAIIMYYTFFKIPLRDKTQTLVTSEKKYRIILKWTRYCKQNNLVIIPEQTFRCQQYDVSFFDLVIKLQLNWRNPPANHLIRLLPVEHVSDVEECLEDLNDLLGHLHGNGRLFTVGKHLIFHTPAHSQALLQGFGQQ